MSAQCQSFKWILFCAYFWHVVWAHLRNSPAIGVYCIHNKHQCATATDFVIQTIVNLIFYWSLTRSRKSTCPVYFTEYLVKAGVTSTLRMNLETKARIFGMGVTTMEPIKFMCSCFVRTFLTPYRPIRTLILKAVDS